jgi:hypothetical protein
LGNLRIFPAIIKLLEKYKVSWNATSNDALDKITPVTKYKLKIFVSIFI